MSFILQPPNLQAISPPNSSTNMEIVWPQSPSAKSQDAASVSSSSRAGQGQKSPIQPEFPRIDEKGQLPNLVPPGAGSNVGAQDLVAALNNCFSGNDLSPENRSQPRYTGSPQTPSPTVVSAAIFQRYKTPSQQGHSDSLTSTPPEKLLTSPDDDATQPPPSSPSLDAPRLSCDLDEESDTSFDSIVPERTYKLDSKLLTLDDVVEFTEMEVAPVTYRHSGLPSAEDRKRDLLVNTAFLRQSLTGHNLSTPEDHQAPKRSAVPYRPISTRNDELIEHLFGPGDSRRGRMWPPPKIPKSSSKPKLPSPSIVTQDDVEIDTEPISSTSESPTGTVEPPTPLLPPQPSEFLPNFDQPLPTFGPSLLFDSSPATVFGIDREYPGYEPLVPKPPTPLFSPQHSESLPTFGPSLFTDLPPGTSVGIDREFLADEPLASTTTIEEVVEDPLPSNDADNTETATDAVETQSSIDISDRFSTPNTSTSGGKTSQPHPSLPWRHLQLSIFDSQSSAWSEENLAALRIRFGTFDDPFQTFDKQTLTGVRPAMPLEGDDIWYEFPEEREGIELGSEYEEEQEPLFLPSDTEFSNEDEDEDQDEEAHAQANDNISSSEDELLIPFVETIQTVNTPSRSLKDSLLRSSSKRRKRGLSDGSETDIPGPSNMLRRHRSSYSHVYMMDIDVDSAEEDQLFDETPASPPKKRKKLRVASPPKPTPTT